MNLYATLWAYSALLLFCLLSIATKELGAYFSTSQIVLFRTATGAFLLLSYIITSRKFSLLRLADISGHIQRNSVHFMGQMIWVFSISVLPLGVVFAVEFTVPFWCLVIAFIVYKVPIDKHQIYAIIISIAGVLFIVGDQISQTNFYVFLMILGAIFYSITHITTKRLLNKNTAITIILYMNVMQIPMGGIGTAVSGWSPVVEESYPWLVMLAFAGVLSHLCLTKAMAHATVSKVMITDTLRLPIITLIGYLLYSENITLFFLIGASFILISNIYNAIEKPSTTSKNIAQEEQ